MLSKCPQANLDIAGSFPGFRCPLITDMGLHYPFYSRKRLGNFQRPENGEVGDQSFEEEVLKDIQNKKIEILHAVYTLQERNMQL